MIESTTTTAPLPLLSVGMRYIAGSRLAVITIDGHRVGEATFIDQRSLEQVQC